MRKFEVTVKVNDLYEIEVVIPYQASDQREGAYTAYKRETMSFISFTETCEWVRNNPTAKVESCVHMTDMMTLLLQNTSSKDEEK